MLPRPVFNLIDFMDYCGWIDRILGRFAVQNTRNIFTDRYRHTFLCIMREGRDRRCDDEVGQIFQLPGLRGFRSAYVERRSSNSPSLESLQQVSFHDDPPQDVLMKMGFGFIFEIHAAFNRPVVCRVAG